MKTLQESLFDDKESLNEGIFGDNIKKDVTIREAYSLLDGRKDLRAGGMSVLQMFNVKKLEKYKNPYHGNFLPGVAPYILGIITDLPVPSEKDHDKGIRCDWGKNAVNILSKYIQRSWRDEFERGFEVNSLKLSNGGLIIRLEFRPCVSRSLDGYYEFIFTPN